MSGRLNTSTKDLRHLLDLTDLAHVDEPGSPSHSQSARASGPHRLRQRHYESHDVLNRHALHYQETSGVEFGGDFTDESVHESFWSLYWRDLCDYWPRIGDHASARRMRAQPEWASWQCSAYAEWIYSIGVRGEINIALAPHAGRP